MGRTLSIAANTLREAVRARVLYLILFFALAVIIGSEAISLLAVGDRQRIVEDLGMAAIQLCGDAICIFLGVSLLSREVERRTVFFALARPVSRAGFVLGKALGLMATVLLSCGAMALVFWGFVWLRFGELHPSLLRAVLMFGLEFLLLTAFAMLYSVFTTPVLASLFSVTTLVVGHLSEGLKLLATHPQLNEVVPPRLALGLYHLLPNLERFNYKTEAVYRELVPLGELVTAVGYGLAYATGVLLLTILLFDRKDFQ